MEASYCTLLVSQGKTATPSHQEIQAELESSDVHRKQSALKQCILMILNGEDMSKLLMTVIRYCITVEDHQVKKLLMYFWEVVQKYDATGNLKPEMILVCNALRNDLNHANEYIRGCTLRFLCKLKERELLEPLVASVKQCLAHRHHYVRRHAVLTVYQLYKTFGADLIPDAPADILAFLEEETDPAARRNAFIMLFNTAEALAIEYFQKNMDAVSTYGDGFQLIVLELCRKVCRADPSQKSRFVKIIFQMLSSTSPAVVFEAAGTLVSLSSVPAAIRAAAGAYTQLLNSESDHNVKLIVLDRLGHLEKAHSRVLQDQVMDILRALSTPDEAIQRKTLDIAMSLVSSRNVEEVMAVLKKEVVRTQAADATSSKAYREMLIAAIHNCAVKFTEVAHSVVLVLMDFLGSDAAVRVMLFVRELVETNPELRPAVLGKLMEVMGDVTNTEVYRVALWILGQYCDDQETLHAALACVKAVVGPLPLVSEDASAAAAAAAGSAAAAASDGGKVEDEDVAAAAEEAAAAVAPASALRKLLLKGDFFLGAVVASTLTKLSLRTQELHGAESRDAKAVLVGAMLVMCAVVELGQKPGTTTPIDQDSFEHIVTCIRMLADPLAHKTTAPLYRELCHKSFQSLVESRRRSSAEDTEEKKVEVTSQADDVIPIRQLRGRRAASAVEVELDDEADISKATGSATDDFASRLQRVHQLSGFADPVYAEAYVTVHDYDIVLDILIINRTDSTLTNVAVELATIGELKLVERPQTFTLGPNDSRTITANIKVSSTETGEIFGTLVFDSSTSASKTVVNLNDIKVDILDYIHPATCTDAAFRYSWSEFEWENKVAVNTTITDLQEFVQHIVKSTNMKCLTPISAVDGSCNFLAANLYARSIFGEDALVNVSVENRLDGSIRGHIRIRSKTQGVALSLGDTITQCQKGRKK